VQLLNYKKTKHGRSNISGRPESYANEMGELREKSRASAKNLPTRRSTVINHGTLKAKKPAFAGFLDNLPKLWPIW
jgi:hypothetical protein